jgi:transposase InsO family protein
MSKTTYDTFLMLSYAQGVRGKIYDNIPSSTKHDWLNRSHDHIYGAKEIAEYAQIIVSAEEQKMLKKSLLTITKLFIIYRNIVDGLKEKNQLLYGVRNIIIKATDQWTKTIQLKRVSKILNINQQLFLIWKKGYRCLHAPFSICRKRFANQLSFSELRRIKKYLTNKRFINWSLISVYYKVLRESQVYFSDRTFYKYCKILGIKKPKKRKRKINIGPRASKPLELLHMDITEYRLMDNVKVFIHMIIDNYSRKILGYKIALNKNAKLAFENLKEVYESLSLEKLSKVEIMSDDGSENKSITAEFISKKNELSHTIARKTELDCTNNMIESVFRKLKESFIYPRDIHNYLAFIKIFDNAVIEYNEVMPLAAIEGRTPNEAFEGVNPFLENLKEKMQKAHYQRYMENKNGRCF